MTTHIVRGAEADALLKDSRFRTDWLRLWECCPWGTAFQHPDYAAVWYAVYRQRWEPVVVVSHTEDGALDGLFALARSIPDGALTAVGGRQAEYQTWISPPDAGDAFACQAVRLLQQHFPHGVLTLQYLPSGTPLEWLASPEGARCVRLIPHRRPLVRFDREEGTESSLTKKRTRYRLKQLEKLGKLNFKRIEDPKEFQAILDPIIAYYEFRQEAVHGSAPFRTDSLKKDLLLVRMRQQHLRLHATVLTLGGEMVSAHVGFEAKKEVHLGLMAHNPFLAKHSPGKFHLLFLSQMLRAEGYARLDLTPGDDSYKDHLANDCDEVHTVTISLSPRQQTREVLRERVVAAARKGMRTCGIEPARVKSLVGTLTSGGLVRTPLRFLRGARHWMGRPRELRIYSFDAAKRPDLRLPPVRRNALNELLAYEPAEDGPSRQSFLSVALARIEDGLHVYTDAPNGRLQHFGWLAERQEKLVFGAKQQEFDFPANSAYLFDFYTFPHARGRGHFTRALQTMLHDAAKIPGTEKIFVAVTADNRSARSVIEGVGFRHEGSLFEEGRFGRTRTGTAGRFTS